MADVRWHTRHDDLCDRLHSAASQLEDISEGCDLDEIETAICELERDIDLAGEVEEDEEEDEEEADE